jgi:hypothetical protein
MRASPALCLLFCSLLTGACDPRPRDTADPAATTRVTLDRAETMRVPLAIEGMVDTLEFRLVRAPADFSVPFSTYVPPDMHAQFETDERGEALYVSARFDGRIIERARLAFYFYPPGSTIEDAQRELGAYLSGLYPDDTPLDRDLAYERAMPVQPADHYPWAFHESSFRVPFEAPDRLLVGRSGVGLHQDRVFHFLIEYPAEYGDGMEPRVAAILDHWRWEDTGRPLGEE